MAQTRELLKKIKNKFPKYRPWDLMGNDNQQEYDCEKNINRHAIIIKNNKNKGNKEIDSDQTANRQQIRQQIDSDQTANRQQIRQQIDSDQTANRQQIRQQIDSAQTIKSEENEENTICRLTGLQKKLFYLVLEHCNFYGELRTRQLKTAQISEIIGCGYKCTKNVIERLIKKKMITRLKGKTSITGFVQFEITKERKIIGNKLLRREINLDRMFEKFISIIRQQIDGGLDSKEVATSSSYLLNTTTTGNTQRSTEPKLPPEWQTIDIEPLNHINFTTTHLSQIAEQNKLQPQAMQDSIYAFAFDLQENNKAKSIKGDPINYFMGILRNGRVYTFPSNYESPQDKAMRLYTEQIRIADQKRKSLEKEAIDLAFDDWFAKLTDAQKIEFLPKMFRHNTDSTKLEKNKMLKASARSHFEAEIWPDKKREITKSVRNSDQDLQSQILTNIEQEVSNVENN